MSSANCSLSGSDAKPHVAPDDSRQRSLCPSAPGCPGGSVLIGVVAGTSDGPRVLPTEAPVEVTDELLALSGPVSPQEIFRFASGCRAEACVHFNDGCCQLARRAVERLAEVQQRAQHCPIRPRCQWFRQEGIAICRRCPQIITEQHDPSPVMIGIVGGGVASSDLVR